MDEPVSPEPGQDVDVIVDPATDYLAAPQDPEPMDEGDPDGDSE